MKKYYSLAHKETKKLIKYTVKSNGDAYFCNETSVILSESGDNDWLVKSKSTAMWAKYGTYVPWHNSGINSPMIDEETRRDYVVVEVEIKINEIADGPDFIMVDDLDYAVDYHPKNPTGVYVDRGEHNYLVVWFVGDSEKYKNQIGKKVCSESGSYRMLLWAGEYCGKQALILSNEYYD